MTTPLMNDHAHIMLIAGEASGDMHGAHLINALKEKNPTLTFSGMGSTQMRNAGMNVIVDAKNLAIMGIVEVFKHIGEILNAFKLIKKAIKTQKPDCIVLIDYPGFNLRLARFAKHQGVKVFYYISPQLWAWKEGRVKIVKKYVDHMAVIFPFEVDFYKKHNIVATYVGHPLPNKINPTMSRENVLKQLNVTPDRLLIGFLPGSRKNELKKIFPILRAAAERIAKKHPEITLVLPLADTLSEEDMRPYLESTSLDIKIVKENKYDVLAQCYAAMVASGTATLELGLLGVPMTLTYKLNQLSALVGRILLKCKYVGICNLIADKEITKEFIQLSARPKAIAKEMLKLIDNKQYHNASIQALNDVKSLLGNHDGSKNTADLILAYL